MSSYYSTIIVPVLNDLSVTKTFINSLYQTASEPLQLIIVNNNSTDETKKYLNKLKYDFDTTNIIHNDKNLGFAQAINQGLKIAKYPYIYIVNNDIKFTARNWLTDCGEILQNKEIGIIGAEYLYTENINFVTGAFMGFRKELTDKIGGLDERFFFSWEDVDICLRSQLAGRAVIQVPVPIIHDYNKPKSETIKKYHGESKQKFIEKWKAFREKKKILHINNQLSVGGIEEVIKYICKYNKEFNMYIIGFKDGKMRKEYEKFPGVNVAVANPQEARTICKALMPDIIHNHTSGGFVPVGVDFANTTNPRPKLITTIHNPSPYTSTKDEILVGVSDTVTASQYKPCNTIENGVELEESKSETDIKTLLGIKENDIVVGRIGRLAPEKGVVDFILVAEKLMHINNLKFLIVGNSNNNYFQECQKFANDLGLTNVIFASEQYDKRKWLEIMDIFLYPTKGEGSGLVILEAAQAKLSIILYDEGVNKEYADFVILVKENSISSLAEAVKRLAGNDIERMELGKLANQYSQKYNAQTMAEKYHNLYKEMIK